MRDKAFKTLIFQHFSLGFVTNVNKSFMETVQTIEYLGLAIESIRMTLSLQEEKVKRIFQECKKISSMKKITVL